ncbi:hypothetical protein DIE06_23270 [Burkholderia sp. Bp8998]|nr:hypothetical protein DIE06_23270 [Burkholderia sp. Bp8998]
MLCGLYAIQTSDKSHDDAERIDADVAPKFGEPPTANCASIAGSRSTICRTERHCCNTRIRNAARTAAIFPRAIK